MLTLFDPIMEQSSIYNENEANLIPVFKEPKMSAGMLPGISWSHFFKKSIKKPCYYFIYHSVVF